MVCSNQTSWLNATAIVEYLSRYLLHFIIKGIDRKWESTEWRGFWRAGTKTGSLLVVPLPPMGKPAATSAKLFFSYAKTVSRQRSCGWFIKSVEKRSSMEEVRQEARTRIGCSTTWLPSFLADSLSVALCSSSSASLFSRFYLLSCFSISWIVYHSPDSSHTCTATLSKTWCGLSSAIILSTAFCKQ